MKILYFVFVWVVIGVGLCITSVMNATTGGHSYVVTLSTTLLLWICLTLIFVGFAVIYLIQCLGTLGEQVADGMQEGWKKTKKAYDEMSPEEQRHCKRVTRAVAVEALDMLSRRKDDVGGAARFAKAVESRLKSL